MNNRTTARYLEHVAHYARMPIEEKIQAWSATRPPAALGTALHRWVEHLALTQAVSRAPATWRYRTGKRGGVRR